MKKTIITYGLLSGLIIMAFMITSTVLWYKDPKLGLSEIIGFTGMFIAFIFVFVGIKNYRDKQNNGILTFGNGFLLGLMISFVASTIYVITWAIEFHFFLPDFMDKYAAMQIKQMHESGIKGAEYDEAIKSIERASYNYKNNPFFFAMYTYMEILPVGIIITLISSLILKRKTKVNL